MRCKKQWIMRLSILLAGSWWLQQASAQSGSFTLRKAVETAVAGNYSLRADSLQIPQAIGRKKETAAAYLPQANLSSQAEYNPEIASQLLPGSVVGQPDKDLVGVQFGTRYNLRSGIEVTQAVYRKDLAMKIRSAGLQTGIARTKYNLSREELVYQVAAAYYSLQTTAEMIRTNTRDYNNMKEVLEIARAQYDNGLLKKIDLESLQINVANLQSTIQQLQTNYNDQLVYFNYLLGIPASAQTIIADSIHAGTYAAQPGDHTLQREDIRLSSQLIEAKEYELKTIRAEKAPSVNSFFRYNYHSQFNDMGKAFGSDYSYKSATVGLSVSVPLLDGNRRKSRIGVARLELDQLKLQHLQQLDKSKMELASAGLAYNNNREQLAITRNNLDLAMNVFESRKALYTEGVSTLMELLEAEKELSNADNLHIQALINVQTATLDMHKANGTLLTEFIQSL